MPDGNGVILVTFVRPSQQPSSIPPPSSPPPSHQLGESLEAPSLQAPTQQLPSQEFDPLAPSQEVAESPPLVEVPTSLGESLPESSPENQRVEEQTRETEGVLGNELFGASANEVAK